RSPFRSPSSGRTRAPFAPKLPSRTERSPRSTPQLASRSAAQPPLGPQPSPATKAALTLQLYANGIIGPLGSNGFGRAEFPLHAIEINPLVGVSYVMWPFDD